MGRQAQVGRAGAGAAQRGGQLNIWNQLEVQLACLGWITLRAAVPHDAPVVPNLSSSSGTCCLASRSTLISSPARGLSLAPTKKVWAVPGGRVETG